MPQTPVNCVVSMSSEITNPMAVVATTPRRSVNLRKKPSGKNSSTLSATCMIAGFRRISPIDPIG